MLRTKQLKTIDKESVRRTAGKVPEGGSQRQLSMGKAAEAKKGSLPVKEVEGGFVRSQKARREAKLAPKAIINHAAVVVPTTNCQKATTGAEGEGVRTPFLKVRGVYVQQVLLLVTNKEKKVVHEEERPLICFLRQSTITNQTGTQVRMALIRNNRMNPAAPCQWALEDDLTQKVLLQVQQPIFEEGTSHGKVVFRHAVRNRQGYCRRHPMDHPKRNFPQVVETLHHPNREVQMPD